MSTGADEAPDEPSEAADEGVGAEAAQDATSSDDVAPLPNAALSAPDTPAHDEPPDADAPAGNPPPTRLCRRCATVTATSGEFCPQCGASYERRRRGPRGWSRRTRWVVGVVVVLLVLGGAGTGVGLKLHADREADRREQAQQRRDEAARQARISRERAAAAEREAAAASEAAELSLRRSTVRALRQSITQDARKRVADGVLDGPIRSTTCQNTDGHESDTSENIAEYDYIAVTEDTAGGGQRGYRFGGRIDFSDGTYTWQLGAN